MERVKEREDLPFPVTSQKRAGRRDTTTTQSEGQGVYHNS